MARPKNPDKKDRVEEMREKIQEAQKIERPGQVVAEMDESRSRLMFSDFWASERKSFGQPREIEEILWAHLKAIKCDRPEKFEEGIAHFGLKR